MRDSFLPFSSPCIDDEEIDEVVDTLRSRWLTSGPKTEEFQRRFARFVGGQEALALNSCTAGLHLALMVQGIGPGDEVITTPMTFVSSVNVIEHVGARPVLADVEPDTLNIDPEAVSDAITERTKAIVPVHYAGHPVVLDRILEVADQHDLVVIEDAAHAVGAEYRGRPIGSGDNPVAFSFYATKNMTTGEGGMLTGTPDFIEKARVLSLHGMTRDAWKRYEEGGTWHYEVHRPGFKYNMTEIQASLGLRQLEKLTGFQERRRSVVARYDEAFSDIEAVCVPASRPHVKHAWHLYVLRLNLDLLDIDRDQFIRELQKRKIGTSVHFIPIHHHPYYRDKYGWQPQDFPVASSNFVRLVSLPLHPGLSDVDVDDVISAVVDTVRASSA